MNLRDKLISICLCAAASRGLKFFFLSWLLGREPSKFWVNGLLLVPQEFTTMRLTLII